MERDEQLAELLQKHLPDGAYDADPPPERPGLAAASPAAGGRAGGLIMYVVRKGGMGSAMAFARSRHRLYDGDSVRVTFDDVAGIDEAVTELREVVGFLKTPEKYQALGGRIPRACSWWVRLARARPCWPGRSLARPACRSSRSPV